MNLEQTAWGLKRKYSNKRTNKLYSITHLPCSLTRTADLTKIGAFRLTTLVESWLASMRSDTNISKRNRTLKVLCLKAIGKTSLHNPRLSNLRLFTPSNRSSVIWFLFSCQRSLRFKSYSAGKLPSVATSRMKETIRTTSSTSFLEMVLMKDRRVDKMTYTAIRIFKHSKSLKVS